jgi:hypothetical protein
MPLHNGMMQGHFPGFYPDGIIRSPECDPLVERKLCFRVDREVMMNLATQFP